MLHPTYKHLDAKLRVGALTLGQWTQFAVAAVLAGLFAVYVSPFPTSVTTFVSIVAAGLPVATSYGAMGLEFSLGEFVASAWRYWRAPRRHLPGPGRSAVGYVVDQQVEPEERLATEGRRASPGNGGADGLWDL